MQPSALEISVHSSAHGVVYDYEHFMTFFQFVPDFQYFTFLPSVKLFMIVDVFSVKNKRFVYEVLIERSNFSNHTTQNKIIIYTLFQAEKQKFKKIRRK